MVIEFFNYLIPFALLLGTLVFIHELGHFWAARFFGVRVEVFSLGFGPKIFKHKKGSTVYCLSLIPLGGYVKMFGDNPRLRVPVGEKKYSFLDQKTGPKMIIALAGPVMNFILAVLLFMAVGMIGREKPIAKVGDIKESSPAFSAGFRSDDIILSINEKNTAHWEDVVRIVESRPEERLEFKIQNQGLVRSINVQPKRIEDKQLTALSKEIGDIEGLSVFSKSSHIGVSDISSRAYKAGLRTFDEIKQIGQSPVSNWRDLQAALLKVKGSVLKVKVKREGEEKLISAVLSLKGFSEIRLSSLGIEEPSLYVDRIKPGSPADSAGLKRGDRLMSLNGKPLLSWENFSSIVKNYDASLNQLNLEILREGKKELVSLTPEKMPLIQKSGQLTHRLMIGVSSAQYVSYPERVMSRILNPFSALAFGWNETLKWSLITAKVIGRLATGALSTRLIGGPLSIAKAAKRSFSDSLIHFLTMMAIISVNLFLMNLLPIPVLDGGHLLLFGIEAVKGSPLSIKKIEMVQMTGFAVILFFVILTLFNDIQNWNLFW